MPRSARLYLAMAAGILCISTAAPLIKACSDAPPAVIAAARLGIASCLLIPIAAFFKGRQLYAAPAGSWKYVLLAGIFLSAHFLSWITSLKHTSVVSSVVIVTTNPIFVGVASYFLFRERMHRGLIMGIVLAVLGGLLIALSDMGKGAHPASLYGDFMALCGAAMASSYWLAGRKLRRRMDALTYVTGVYAVAAVILVGVALAEDHSFLGYRPRTYLCFVALAVIPQLLGNTTFNWALRHVSATTVAVFILGEPIGAGILAYLFLQESVSLLQTLGSGLILFGIVTAVRGSAGTAQSIESESP